MQTRTQSLIEQVLNVGSGFALSLLLWLYVIVPVWDLPVQMSDNIQITAAFTVVSVIRGYAWRRIFNNKTAAEESACRLTRDASQPNRS